MFRRRERLAQQLYGIATALVGRSRSAGTLPLFGRCQRTVQVPHVRRAIPKDQPTRAAPPARSSDRHA